MTEQIGMRNHDPPPYKESTLCSICQSRPSSYDYVKCKRCIGHYNVCQYCEDVLDGDWIQGFSDQHSMDMYSRIMNGEFCNKNIS